MDSGAFALAHFLRLHGVADAHPEQFKRDDAPGGMGLKEMLKGARDRGVKAYAHTTDWSRLMTARFPVIAVLTGGGDSLLLEKIVEDNVFVLRPSTDAHEPLLLTRDQFEKIWSGDILFADQDVVAPSAPVGGAVQSVGRIGTHRPEILEPGNSEDDPIAEEEARIDESGLGALVLLLNFHGIGADAAQIKHRLGVARVGVVDMLRCAKQLGLKASGRATRWDRLATTPLPGIAPLRDGGFLILGKVGDDQVLVQHPASPQPETMTRREFRSDMGRPAGADGPPFGARRASPPLRHHVVSRCHPQIPPASRRGARRVFRSPAFRAGDAAVLPGRDRQGAGASQPEHLDVLIGGLVILTLAEGLLGALKTYLFTHTTNRIDVELGARLFRHLMALPMAYFQARRVGDLLARVRELENIRQFLTSSALTLVVDLFFTFAFLAVMFYYSATLDLDRPGVLSFLYRAFGRRRAVVPPAGSTKNSSAARKTRVFWSSASRASRR